MFSLQMLMYFAFGNIKRRILQQTVLLDLIVRYTITQYIEDSKPNIGLRKKESKDRLIHVDRVAKNDLSDMSEEIAELVLLCHY